MNFFSIRGCCPTSVCFAVGVGRGVGELLLTIRKKETKYVINFAYLLNQENLLVRVGGGHRNMNETPPSTEKISAPSAFIYLP